MEAIAGIDDLAFVLLSTLASFGITFTAAGGIDQVAPFVMEQFDDYLSGIGESVDQVASSFRYGVSKAGQFLANLPVLEYSRNFGIFIQDQFNLSDNSSISTAPPQVPGYFLSDGTPIVIAPFSESYSGVSSTIFYDNTLYTLSNGTSFMLSSASNTLYIYRNDVLISQSSVYNYAGPFYYFYSQTVPFNVSATMNLAIYFSNGNFSPVYLTNSYNSALEFFGQVSDPPAVDSVTINTGSIDIPQVGDYSDDDGILIDGLGSWGDTLQDIWNKVSGLTLPDSSWPTVTWGAELADQLVDALVSAGELTTENSPGFYNGLPLIGGIPDIQFGNLWHYVTDWVGSMSGGLALIGGIMFSLPFVAAFYALVVILLVLSLWRLLRSA